jgi:hypothetical protein
MSTFIAAVLAFPTVVFTVMLAFFVLYALATLAGAADFEWLDGVLGIDEVSDSALETFLDGLGIAGIPITIFGGIGCLIAWVGSYLLDRALPDGALINGGIGLAAGVGGLLLAALIVRPLKPLFVQRGGQHRSELIGKICTVRSLSVTDQNGTAEVGDVIAEVRCFHDNKLTLGSPAIVYDYDSEQGTYHVGPIDPSIARTEIV